MIVRLGSYTDEPTESKALQSWVSLLLAYTIDMPIEEGLDVLHQLYRDKPDIAEGKTEDEFVDYHKTRIQMKNKGYWVDPDAAKYITKLKDKIGQ